MWRATKGDRGGVSAPPQAAARLYVLDGLRLVAALTVVLYHYVSLPGGWGSDPNAIFPTLHKFAQYGWLGVDLFFLISGFVICMSAWGRSLGDFVVSRASRLYPAYWAGILLTTGVLTVWPQVYKADDLDIILSNFSMLQTGLNVPDVDGAYWTLFTELRFYIVFAIVVATGVTYRKCVLFCGIWTVGAMITPKVGNDLLATWTMPAYSPYFVAGIAFFLMYRFKPNAVLWGIVGISFVLAQHYVELRMKINLGDPHYTSVPGWPVRFTILLCFAVMAGAALGRFDRVQWKWLTTAGALTYPLYVIHMYIGMTIIRQFRDRVPAATLLVGVVALMVPVAWAIHRFVERPTGKLLRDSLKRGMAEIRRDSASATPKPAPPAPAADVRHAFDGHGTEHAGTEHAYDPQSSATIIGQATPPS
ncbi:acyltransferase family protein [Embleya sp. NBC_00896]|uniref:acyltransferase family protein n=1 Tax=Embleya sp. NBC_00896 TaxID=2975961 RepID=UPI00386C9D6B|nr:acyltransferase [Embleya sp. NBC_00896]